VSRQGKRSASIRGSLGRLVEEVFDDAAMLTASKAELR
jgi:hypothetical protein